MVAALAAILLGAAAIGKSCCESLLRMPVAPQERAHI